MSLNIGNPLYGGYGSSYGAYGLGSQGGSQGGSGDGENIPDKVVRSKSDAGDCETCKSRKYVDGSDEMVSFKSPTHVSPEAASSAVRSHEQEHVTNAYDKAAQGNGKVVSANVQIHTAVCPECGRTYVSGGTTSTQIKYYNEENPYQKALKEQDGTKYRGNNLDLAV